MSLGITIDNSYTNNTPRQYAFPVITSDPHDNSITWNDKDIRIISMSNEVNIYTMSLKDEENIRTVLDSQYFVFNKVEINSFELPREIKLNQRRYYNYKNTIFKYPWIEDFIHNISEINDAKTLLPYYKSIQHLIREKDFETCNILFDMVEVKNLNETLMIGLLRLTNPWKNKLLSWKDFLNKVHIELESRSHESNDLLRGLS